MKITVLPAETDRGLISRDVIASDDDTVTLVERWDLTHPNCPIVVVRPVPINADAKRHLD